MQDILTALFLGFIEGLTEFIPVSSTAHLVLLVQGLKFPAPPGHVFEVFIQLGAIFAVIVLYRQKLIHTALHLHDDQGARRFALNLIVGTIPALVAGALGRGWIKEHLYNPTVISVALIAGGIVILLLEKRMKAGRITNIDDIPLKTAFLIGCCQTIALVPGVSRSGATIIGALGLGLSRPAAAEFSFFLAIPVMLAAVTYDMVKSWGAILEFNRPELMLAGFLAAFVTALLVLKAALGIINRYGFTPFALYRIAVGVIILAVLF